jgi:hypothetical protein
VCPRQLIDLADEALLFAKRCGRNCTIAYGLSRDLHHPSDVGEQGCVNGLSGVFAKDIMTTPAVTLLIRNAGPCEWNTAFVLDRTWNDLSR